MAKKLVAQRESKAGLTVACQLDTADYPKGIKVSDAEMDTLAITGAEFHPEWNYTFLPRKQDRSVVLA